MKIKPTEMQFTSKSFNTLFNKQRNHIDQQDNDEVLLTVRDFDKQLEEMKRRQFSPRSEILVVSPALNSQKQLPYTFKSQSSRTNDDLMDKYARLVRHASNTMIDSQELSQFCQQFQINQLQLTSMRTLEEREIYVIKCMNQSITEAINTFTLKYQQQLCSQAAETQHDLNTQKRDQKTKNLFEWIDVKCRYESLKSKLKYALVQTINERSNQSQIIEYFKKPSYGVDKITEVNRHSRNTSDFTSGGATRHSSNQLSESHSHVAMSQRTLYLQPRLNQPKIAEIKAPVWTHDLEDNFLSHRVSATKRLFKEIDSTSWNSIALYPVIQNDQKKKFGQGLWSQQRDMKLQSYVNGNFLSAEDREFITNTSQLLNACIDQGFIQKAIDYLDNDIIKNLELKIADNILLMYDESQKEFATQRKQWFDIKVQSKKQQIKKYDTELEKRTKTSIKQQQLIRIKSKIFLVLKEYDHKKDEKKKYIVKQINSVGRNSLRTAQIHKWVLQFKDKVMNIVKKNRLRRQRSKERKDDFLVRNTISLDRKILFEVDHEPKTTRQIQRLNHPSSKLLMNAKKNDGMTQPRHSPEMVEKFRQQDHNRYKLRIQNENSKDKKEFIQFFSGGPQKDRPYAKQSMNQVDDARDQHLPHRQAWITEEIEIKASDKIKAWIKGHLQRKIYKKLKEASIQKKQRDIDRQVKKILAVQQAMDYMKSHSRSRRQRNFVQNQSPEKVFTFNNQDIQSNQSPQTTQTSQIANIVYERKYAQSRYSLSNTDIKKHTSSDKNNKTLTSYEKSLKLKQQMKNDSATKLKHRKLLMCAKLKNLGLILSSGFDYFKQDVDCKDKFTNTPLYYAAFNGDEKFCNYLFKLGADVNIRCENGNTPLHMAFQSGNDFIVTQMLHLSGDLNNLNTEGQTPIAFGSPKLLKTLNMMNIIASVQNPKGLRITSANNNLQYDLKYQKSPQTPEVAEFRINYLQKYDRSSSQQNITDVVTQPALQKSPESYMRRSIEQKRASIDIFKKQILLQEDKSIKEIQVNHVHILETQSDQSESY